MAEPNMSEPRDSTKAYEKIQAIKAVCKVAKDKQAAKAELERQGLWFEFVADFRGYMDLPSAT